jgi:hypothetical protein
VDERQIDGLGGRLIGVTDQGTRAPLTADQ